MSKSFFQLSVEEIAAACQVAKANIKVSVITMTPELCDKMLGVRVLAKDDTTPALFSDSAKNRYVCDNNGTNRPLNMTNMRELRDTMLARRFAGPTGEPLIVSDTKRIISAQHRLIAYKLATLVDPTLRIDFVLVEGIPEELADVIDTGKSRNNKDTSARHLDVLPVDLLRNVMGLSFGSKANDVRTSMLGDLNTATRLVSMRAHGKDVKGSSRHKQTEFFDIRDKFDNVGDFNGLDALVNLVYAYDTGLSGKDNLLQKAFGRGAVVAMLALYANTNNPPQVAIEGKKRIYTLPETLHVDLDFAKRFLQAAESATGFLAPVFLGIEAATKGRATLESPYRVGALVNAIKWFADNHKLVEIPAGVNPETGEAIGEATIQVQCPPMPNHGIPPAPRKKPNSDDTYAWVWPHFGGLDVGYQEPLGPSVEE